MIEFEKSLEIIYKETMKHSLPEIVWVESKVEGYIVIKSLEEGKVLTQKEIDEIKKTCPPTDEELESIHGIESKSFLSVITFSKYTNYSKELSDALIMMCLNCDIVFPYEHYVLLLPLRV